ncbi:hypothetical protein ACHAXA_002395 [Cyclostephanos tholiformis]|uniref:Uncharacterized protein n=1 Tax=Cyclostephanos tholiformis TaxID=382380 RepID=A0ABD3RA12_9STRA
MSDEGAIDHLMLDHDVDEKYAMERLRRGIDTDEDGPYYVTETYFVAIYNSTDRDMIDSFDRQNGVVGVVSAQPRRG